MVTLSVLIATRDRPEPLARCIESVLAQDLPDTEILVFDDGSDPPVDANRLPSLPEVPLRVLRSEENLGVVHARNTLMQEAKGQFLLLVDDDAALQGPHAVRALIHAFEEHPQAGILAGRLFEDHDGARQDLVPFPRRGRGKGRLEHPGPSSYFLGGLHAVRAGILDRVDGYEPRLFFGEEELDLSYKVINEGFQIHYIPELLARHSPPVDATAPMEPPRLYYSIRNRIYLAGRYLPVRYWPTYLSIWTLILGSRAIRNGHGASFLLGLRDGWRLAREVDRDRLSPVALLYLRNNHGRLWY